MMKITCFTPARTLAMVAASAALSVWEKWLFVATCDVSVASAARVGSGKLCRPAFTSCGLYSLAA